MTAASASSRSLWDGLPVYGTRRPGAHYFEVYNPAGRVAAYCWASTASAAQNIAKCLFGTGSSVEYSGV